MREKIKDFSRKYLIGFILGVISACTISVIAATYFPSNDVTYDNSSSGLQSTNVQGAIDELYTECTYEPTGGEQILDKENIVTSGDGLYEDEYEEGRYFYKGANPNNYITFNGETAGWRIISIEADGTIKIMKIASIGNYAWDSSSNDWATSDLNTYLNGTYLNGLSQTAQDQIVSHNFSIGSVTHDNNDLADQISDENSNKWNGKVGLATASEYLRSNSNPGSCRSMRLINDNYNTCKSTTWMFFNSANWWTMSPLAGNSYYAFFVFSDGFFYYGNTDVLSSYGVRPALYLSSSVTLNGSGTQSDPYVIN